MPKLAMGESTGRLAVGDQAHADARAYGDVSEIVAALPRAPAHLGQRGAVDIGIEHRRDPRGFLQAPEYVAAAPARFGRTRDLSETWRIGIEINGSKTPDPQRREALP